MTEIIPPPGDPLTAGMLDALRKTKPWVRLLSILGFLFVVLMALLGIVIAIIGFAQESGPLAGEISIVLGLFYVVLGVVYFVPALYLFRYASAIGEALQAPVKAAPVENALRQQKSFWKFAGILTAIGIAVYLVAFVVILAVPGLSKFPWGGR